MWLIPVMLCGPSAHAGEPSRQEQVIVESFQRRLPENVRRRMDSERALAGKTYDQQLEAVIAQLPQGALSAARNDLSAMRRSATTPAAQAAIGQAFLKLGDATTALEVANEQSGEAAVAGPNQWLKAQALRRLGRYEEANAAAQLALNDPRTRSRAGAFLRLREGGGGDSGPAPARRMQPAAFPGSGGGGRRGFSNLSREQRQRLDGALVVLGRSETGQRILKLAVPDADGVYNLQSLEEGGIAMMVDETGAVTGHAAVEQADAAARRLNIEHVIRFNPRVLARESPELLAALVGEKVDNVNWIRRWGGRASEFAMNLYGRVQRFLLATDLDAITAPTAGQSDLQNDVNFDSFMLSPNSTSRPATATFGKTNDDRIGSYLSNRNVYGKPAFEAFTLHLRNQYALSLESEVRQPWFPAQGQAVFRETPLLLQGSE